MKDKSHYSNHIKKQYYLLSSRTQKSQHNNWISLTKKIKETATERMEKQNHDFSKSWNTCQSTLVSQNFKFHNSLKLSFTNIQGLRSNFVDCEPFLESNSWQTAVCEANLDDSIDSDNFSVRGYLPLIRKNSSTHAWSSSLCERRTSFCMGLISRKLLTYVFDWLYFTQCLTSFSSINHLHLYAWFFNLFHLT